LVDTSTFVDQIAAAMRVAYQSIVSGLDLADILDLMAGAFALVLAGISLYAWISRRQRGLLMVSAGFFLFSVRVAIQVLPVGGIDIDSVSFFLDFMFLALFFFAIVLRPRRN
jgi:hypothetical protein